MNAEDVNLETLAGAVIERVAFVVTSWRGDPTLVITLRDNRMIVIKAWADIDETGDGGWVSGPPQLDVKIKT